MRLTPASPASCTTRAATGSAVSRLMKYPPLGEVQVGLAQALGVGVHAVVAHDSSVAGHLSDGEPRPRKFDSTPLVRSLRAAASVLAGRMARASEVVAR